MFMAENEVVGLVPYTHDDDFDMHRTWMDPVTKRGYNFSGEFAIQMMGELSEYPFWVVAVEKATGVRVGVLRLGKDLNQPDLAIWIYPEARGRGLGTAAFSLASEYLLANGYDALYAGCYVDNAASLRMLARSGYVRRPELDEEEENAFTGKKTVQLGFIRRK